MFDPNNAQQAASEQPATNEAANAQESAAQDQAVGADAPAKPESEG